MRILVHDYSGHPFQVQLSRWLAQNGHSVFHRYSGSIQTPRGALQRRADDAPGFDIAALSLPAPLAKYSYFRRRAQERAYGALLAAETLRLRPDIVISSNAPPDILPAFQRASRQVSARFVFWVQDIYAEAIAHLLARRSRVVATLAGAWYRRVESTAMRASDAVVAITEDFLPLLARWGVARERFSVIENWAPLQEMPRRPKNNAWAATQGLDGRFCFLYAGTLGLKHDPALLVALAQAYRSDPEIAVVVLSEGIGADFLACQKAELGLANLILLPFQPFTSMPDVLASADVLIALLEPEAGIFSVPSKILTYLCAGRALLLSIPAENLGARTVERVGAGLWASPGDRAGFLASAHKLREDAALRAACGEKARHYAENTFDIDRIGARFLEVFATIDREKAAQARRQR